MDQAPPNSQPNPDTAQEQGGGLGILARLGIALASGAAALGALEVAATVHLGERFVRGAELGNSWKSAGQRDAHMGWGGKPGVTTRIVDGQLDYTVELNELGFRDEERTEAKPAGKRRVLALGDSVTWGWGVQHGERFSDLLEERLGPDVEVLNMGMPGYGTDQHYWTLLEHGLSYEPDLVLLCFVLNDVPEAEADKRYGMPKPRFVRGPDGWRVEGRPVELPEVASDGWAQALWRRWTTRSALLTLASKRALAIPEPQATEPVRYRGDRPQTPEPVRQAGDKIAAARSVTHHALTLIRDACVERGIGLLITHVPHKHDQYLYEPEFPAPKPLGKRPFRSYISRSLTKACSKLGVPFIPVDEAFLQVCRKGQSLHVGDGHPNALGHRLIADKLETALRSMLQGPGPKQTER